MNAGEIRLAPGVPGIESLGARSFEDFFRPIGSGGPVGPGGPIESSGASGFERAKIIRSESGLEVVRYPLPGTPDENGRFRGLQIATGGAGTGWLLLRRFTRAAWSEWWSARFTHPRSTSLAEREWNLLCHLRAHGVGAPEPLAVGRGEGAVFAQRSFLVMRELDGMLSLREWSRAQLDERMQARIARSLGIAIARLSRSGVVLPRADADTIFAGSPRHPQGGDPDCVARQIAGLTPLAGVEPPRERREGELTWGRLPEIAFTDMKEGRMTRESDRREHVELLVRLARELPDIGDRIALRVARHALGREASRAERRALLRARVLRQA